MELLEMVGLSEYALTKAGNLAYGTQRKVEIARALAMKPDILLLDEPAAVSYTHLDVYKIQIRGGVYIAVPDSGGPDGGRDPNPVGKNRRRSLWRGK